MVLRIKVSKAYDLTVDNLEGLFRSAFHIVIKFSLMYFIFYHRLINSSRLRESRHANIPININKLLQRCAQMH